MGLVVKKGSKMRSAISFEIPLPVSVTQIDRYWPGGRSRSREARSSSHLFAVSIVSRPPSGIASRALIERFRSALSSCAGSTLVSHRSEEHTSELQSLMRISYAVFCLKKKKHKN